MRVIGGVWRGRPLAAPPGADVRPTSDKVREAIFDILRHRDWGRDAPLPENARVLDACCGTGALGIEALSLGATHVTFADVSAASLRVVQANGKALQIPAERFSLWQGDVLKIPTAPAPCDLLFLDPPYRQEIPAHALKKLQEQGWLPPSGLAVVETAGNEALPLPDGMILALERRYGDTRVNFVTC